MGLSSIQHHYQYLEDACTHEVIQGGKFRITVVGKFAQNEKSKKCDFVEISKKLGVLVNAPKISNCLKS